MAVNLPCGMLMKRWLFVVSVSSSICKTVWGYGRDRLRLSFHPPLRCVPCRSTRPDATSLFIFREPDDLSRMVTYTKDDVTACTVGKRNNCLEVFLLVFGEVKHVFKRFVLLSVQNHWIQFAHACCALRRYPASCSRNSGQSPASFLEVVLH